MGSQELLSGPDDLLVHAISRFQLSTGPAALTTDEALSRIYKGYDPATKTAKWECTAEQLKNGGNEDWIAIVAGSPFLFR